MAERLAQTQSTGSLITAAGQRDTLSPSDGVLQGRRNIGKPASPVIHD
jgi:hypothetical protein